MANMMCKCGNRMSNVGFPNTLEGEIKGIYEYSTKDVWECEGCGRLYIDIDDPDVKGCHISKSYVPEDGKVGNLFNVGNDEQLLDYLKEFWLFHGDDLKKLGIIQDKEPILNACIQDYFKQLYKANDYIRFLEDKIEDI